MQKEEYSIQDFFWILRNKNVKATFSSVHNIVTGSRLALTAFKRKNNNNNNYATRQNVWKSDVQQLEHRTVMPKRRETYEVNEPYIRLTVPWKHVPDYGIRGRNQVQYRARAASEETGQSSSLLRL